MCFPSSQVLAPGSGSGQNQYWRYRKYLLLQHIDRLLPPPAVGHFSSAGSAKGWRETSGRAVRIRIRLAPDASLPALESGPGVPHSRPQAHSNRPEPSPVPLPFRTAFLRSARRSSFVRRSCRHDSRLWRPAILPDAGSMGGESASRAAASRFRSRTGNARGGRFDPGDRQPPCRGSLQKRRPEGLPHENRGPRAPPALPEQSGAHAGRARAYGTAGPAHGAPCAGPATGREGQGRRMPSPGQAGRLKPCPEPRTARGRRAS